MILNGRRVCDLCQERKCSRFHKVPLGNPVKKTVYICGKCIVRRGQQVRIWLDAQEKKLNEGKHD